MFDTLEQPLPTHSDTVRSVDSLERELLALEAVVSRARSRQTELLAELDRAQVATADGCRSLREWVAGRLDVSPATARDLIQLTHSAPARVSSLLGSGDMTFDRAVATTQLAMHGVDVEVLDASLGWDVAGVRRLVAKHRLLTPADERDTHASRSLSIQPSLDNLTATLWATLVGPDSSTVLDAISAIADAMPLLPDGSRDTLSRRQADALVALCAGALDPDTPAGRHSNPGPTLLVTTDLDDLVSRGGEVGAEVVGGLRMGLQRLEEVFCNGIVNLNLRLTDGRILAVAGHQPIPPRTRQDVLARDGACTAAGCRSRYRLEVHHIIPRSHGGNHHPSNLTTLCWYHHHVVVHGAGFRIDPESPPRRRRFVDPVPARTGTDPP